MSLAYNLSIIINKFQNNYNPAHMSRRVVDPVIDVSHFASEGKMILLTKKKITMETPPLSTVVPML